MTDADILHALVAQLRVNESRCRTQVESLARIEGALRDNCQGQLAAAVHLVAAEVEHAADAWRRAIEQAMVDTAPLRGLLDSES